MIVATLLLSILISSNPIDSVDQARICTDLSLYIDSISPSNSDSIHIEQLTPDQVGKVRNCPGLAGRIIPGLWWQAKNDSAYLANLMLASATVKDRRIESALKQVLHDSTKEYWVRIAALHSLVAYDKGIVAVVEGHSKAHLENRKKVRRSRLPPEPPETWFIWFGAQKISQVDGDEPILPDFQTRLVANMRQLLNDLYPDSKGRFKNDMVENLYEHVKSIAGKYGKNKGPSL